MLVGSEIHRRELPDLPSVIDARFETALLLVHAHLEPILDEDDPRLDHRLLDLRRDLQETVHGVARAKAHYLLDARAIVPTTVEHDDFARRRKVPHVTLYVHLRFFTLGRSRQRDDAKNAGTDAFADRLDDAALARPVSSLEDDADLEAFFHDPQLQLHQFDLQLCEGALVFLRLQLLGGQRRGRRRVLL